MFWRIGGAGWFCDEPHLLRGELNLHECGF
jgi:hypothetical protein